MALDVGTLSGRIKIDTSDVGRATRNLNKLNQTVQGGAQRQQQASRTVQSAAQNQQKATERVARSTKKASQATEKYSVDTTDLSKSVQVALGPLSGVAARITALTAIFNRNNIALASTLGLFTAFIVSMSRSITVGSRLERQLMGTQAIIDSLGESVEITAMEINEMAQALGRDTLTSATEARQAFNVLLTSGIESRDMLNQAATAAQGMASALGKNLQNSARRLGRVLEKPTENLNSLRRHGIQFSEQQKEQIERMERVGDVAGAQAAIMERLSAFTELAEGETQGLAGAMDTLQENFLQAFENAGLYGGVVETLTGSVDRLAEAVRSVAENQQIIQGLGRAFELVADTLAASLSWVFENIDIVTSAMTALFVGLIAGRVVAIITRLKRLVISTGGTFYALAGAITGTTSALGGLIALSRAFPLLVAATAAFKMFEAMNDEVDELGNKLAETERKMDDISSKSARIGVESDGMDQLERRFNLVKTQIEEIQTEYKEAQEELDRVNKHVARSEFHERARDGETAAQFHTRLVEEQKQAIANLASEQEHLQETLDAINEDIEEYNENLIESAKVMSDFGASTQFISQMESDFMSTRAETREFQKNLEDMQEIEQNLFASGVTEEKLQRFREQTGMTREEFSKLVEVMEDEDPRKSFAQDLNEIMEEVARFRSVDFKDLTADIDRMLEQRSQRASIAEEVDNLTEAKKNHAIQALDAAGKIDAETASTEELIDAVIELRTQKNALGDAEDIFGDIKDFLSERDADFARESIEKEFDARRQSLEDALGDDKEYYKEHFDTLDRMERERIRNIETPQTLFDDEIESIRRRTEAYDKGAEAVDRYNARQEVANITGQRFSDITEEQVDVFMRFSNAAEKSEKRLERVQTAAEQFGDAVADSFTDAIIEADNLSDALNDLGKEIARITLRQGVSEPMADMLTEGSRSTFASMFGQQQSGVGTGSGYADLTLDGSRASGGPVQRGETYLVGERGPELFTPNSSGGIMNNSRLTSGGGGDNKPIVNVYNESGEEAQVEQRQEGGQDIVDVIIPAVQSGIQQGKLDGSMMKRFQGLKPKVGNR